MPDELGRDAEFEIDAAVRFGKWRAADFEDEAGVREECEAAGPL
jgi:hypothetical protein